MKFYSDDRGLGRSRWQPIFPNGQRLWWRERDLSAEWRYSNDAGLPPRVYRFRWRAVRVAKARWGERVQGVGIEKSERYCEVIAKRLAQGVLDFGEGRL